MTRIALICMAIALFMFGCQSSTDVIPTVSPPQEHQDVGGERFKLKVWGTPETNNGKIEWFWGYYMDEQEEGVVVRIELETPTDRELEVEDTVNLIVKEKNNGIWTCEIEPN